MNTVGKIIQFVSTQLTDQQRFREYSHWSRQLLLDYMNQGLKAIAAYRPEAYSTTGNVDLVPGTVQKLPPGSTFTGVIGVVTLDPTGKPITTPTAATMSDSALLKAFRTYDSCPIKYKTDANGALIYEPKNVAVDENDPSIFYVTPPVPPGYSAQLAVTYEASPQDYTLADWNAPVNITAKYYNVLLDYMQGRAYQKDTESQVSHTQGKAFMQAAYSVLGVQYRMDSARGSGYYEGRVGDGDNRAIVR